jgi:hypothetical protein
MNSCAPAGSSFSWGSASISTDRQSIGCLELPCRSMAHAADHGGTRTGSHLGVNAIAKLDWRSKVSLLHSMAPRSQLANEGRQHPPPPPVPVLVSELVVALATVISPALEATWIQRETRSSCGSRRKANEPAHNSQLHTQQQGMLK